MIFSTILIFILILSILVLVHEFGHFLAAKFSGVRVEEFGLGLPPRLFGFQLKETLYSLNLLPIGGFVRLAGEDAGQGTAEEFPSKGMLSKVLIVIAGVLMNRGLGYCLLSLGLLKIGAPIVSQHLLIDKVSQNSPAQSAGLMPGDEIIKADTQNVDWSDALTNYISALGWPEDEKKFEEFWGTKEKPLALQVAGKDNLRQQSSMWQAMLLAADLPTTRQIFIHGFITSGGQKMSKSLGNVIDPIEYVEKYGTDALRYYLLAKISPTEDSDFTKEKFEEAYNGDLANGLGNLVARVAALCEKSSLQFTINESIHRYLDQKIETSLNKYRFDEALKIIWKEVAETDQFINSEEPWKLAGQDLEKVLVHLVGHIRSIAFNLKPFLPETSEKIEKQFEGPKIKSEPPLFPRL